MLDAEEPFGHRVIEKREQAIEVAVHVEQPAGLPVDTELRPRPRPRRTPRACRRRPEVPGTRRPGRPSAPSARAWWRRCGGPRSVRATSRASTPSGIDPGDLAACAEDGVGKETHQPHACAAVHEPRAPAGESRAEVARGGRILRADTRARSAEHAEAAHGEQQCCSLPTAAGLVVRRVGDGSAGCGLEAAASWERMQVMVEPGGIAPPSENVLASESTCVSASVVSLPASRRGQNRRKPAKVAFRSRQPWRPTAAILLKWHPFPTRGLIEADVAA